MSTKRECGQRRYRVRHYIKAALVGSGMTQARLAALAGVSQQTVSATVNGRIHSPAVLQKLRELGVDEEYICDPHREEAVQARNNRRVA